MGGDVEVYSKTGADAVESAESVHDVEQPDDNVKNTTANVETDENKIENLEDKSKESDNKNDLYVLLNSGKKVLVEEVKISQHDFRISQHFSPVELQFLKQEHERWLNSINVFLSLSLKANVECSFDSFSLCTLENFLNKLSEPSHIVVFKLNIINGIGICSVEPKLSISLVNRVFGGSGVESNESRVLTEIEKTIVNDLVCGCLKNWCQNWEKFCDNMLVELVGNEDDKRFIPVSKKALTVCLSFVIKIKICDKEEGSIHFSFPCEFLHPIVLKFMQSKQKLNVLQKNKINCVWREAYEGIDLPVIAEWEIKKYNVKDVLNWDKNSLLKLPLNCINNTMIKINEQKKFIGEVGIADDHVSVQITKNYLKQNE